VALIALSNWARPPFQTCSEKFSSKMPRRSIRS
jgi:hypothetical protein